MDEVPSSPDNAELDSEDSDQERVIPTGILPDRKDLFDGRPWYEDGGDPLKRAQIFELPPGDERTQRMRKIVEDFPSWGQKVYGSVAEAGRPDLIYLLLELGASAVTPKEDIRSESTSDDDEILSECDEESSDEDTNDEESSDGGTTNEPPRMRVSPKVYIPPPEIYYPPLHTAVVHEQLECVQVLVDHANVSIDAYNKPGETALMLAATCGYSEIFSWLLSRGASISIKPRIDCTPDILSRATSGGNIDIVKTIIGHEKAKSAGLYFTIKSLNSAARGGNVEILDLVLSSDCLPAPTGDLTDLTGDQKEGLLDAIESAVGSGSRSCLEKLLPYATSQRADGSYNYFQGNNYFENKVSTAMEHGIIEEVDDPDLFQIAWNTMICAPHLDAQDPTSLSPRELDDDATEKRELLHACLILAVQHGRVETVKRICERYDVDVNCLAEFKYSTPLGGAVENHSRDYPQERLAIAEYLLENTDVDIHVGQSYVANGESCLAAALSAKYTEMVRLLLRYGGPVESIDEDVYRYAKAIEDGSKALVAFVVNNHSRRSPVRVMTPKAAEILNARDNEMEVTMLEWEKDELIEMLENLQIRKTAEQLLWADPTRQIVQFQH